MAVIQGKGLQSVSRGEVSQISYTSTSKDFMSKIKADTSWIQAKVEDILAAFILPPLQVVAAAVNFCMLLITSTHLFTIPLKTLQDIKTSKVMIERISQKKETLKQA